MLKFSKVLALAALLFAVMACSLFTGTPVAPSPTPRKALPATKASSATRQVAATNTAPADTPEATRPAVTKSSATKPATKAATFTPTLGKVEPSATVDVAAQSSDQLDACLKAFPTDMPTVEQMITSGNAQGARPLVSCDNFTDNSNGWNLGPWNGKYVQGNETIQDGKWSFVGTAKDGGILYDAPANTGSYPDFSAVVSARIVNSPAKTKIGIIYRNNGTDFYFFAVSSTTYELYLYQNDTWKHLIDQKPLPSGIDLTTQPAWIVVDVIGDVHTFYINNEQVDMLVDSTLTDGSVSIAMDIPASDNGAKSTLEVYHFLLRGK